MNWRIVQGDCLDVLKTLPDNSVDSCVTDPPYGLHFMGKKWDCEVPGVDVWREVLRVLKPGGHLLCFAGTRTQHRMACAIEDAGFEIRDCIMWVYGSGFPKSLAVGKAIDREAGAVREVTRAGNTKAPELSGKFDLAASVNRERRDSPATPEAATWEGWGTALKPALEPITVARKPLQGTVAQNVLKWGTGAINVDGGRVDAAEGRPRIVSKAEASVHAFGDGLNGSRADGSTNLGRWPANLIHDGSQEVLGLFPDRPGMSGGGKHKPGAKGGMFGAIDCEHTARGDNGSAARFFYCAKASKRDRDDGLGDRRELTPGERTNRKDGSAGINAYAGATGAARNGHPTVKPTDLMRYLCRLVTPPGGLVLDPFTGSGSTGRGAVLEGFRFLGIEREAEYADIATARMEAIECQRQ